METRAHSGGSGGSPDGGDGEETREAPVLSLHQILTLHTSNEYTEGPVATSAHSWTTALQPSGPSMDEDAVQDGTLSRDSRDFQDSHDSGEVQNSQDLRGTQDFRDSSQAPQGAASRSTSGTSEGSCSNSSEQRLLGNVARTTDERMPVVLVQPKRSETKQEKMKPLVLVSGGGKQHSQRCERCQRCKCEDCRSPRALPACWLCGRRCLCSAESTVDYATCACCLKALFYHCSTDDEDVCADKPFSCHQPHCCVRWSVAGALAFIFPCLLCYLPARGCLAVCQACHNLCHRPGCRCRNSDVKRCKNIT